MIIKVQVLTQCEHCNGEAYLPMGEAEDCQGHKYSRYIPCPICEGSGNEAKWINLDVFAKLLRQAEFPTSIHPIKAVCASAQAAHPMKSR